MISRRKTLFFLGLSGAAGCNRANRLRLNVFNWSNYVAESTIPRFESETGIRVRYAIYESNEEMLARVMTGNSGWDIVFPSNYFIAPMREMSLLAPLDHTRLGHMRNLGEIFQRPVWDQDLKWNLPYMWGSSGILFNAHGGATPTSWADLWTARFRGRMTMLDDPAEVFGAALKKLGRSLNAGAESDLRAAQQEALRQKPLLRAYLNAEVRDQMVAGDMIACQLWATTAQQAIDAAPHLAYVYPSEGYALYADCAALLRESRRADLAHQFLDYLFRPEVAADIVSSSRTATANGAARELLPKPVGTLRTLYPDAETLARGEWFAPLAAPAQRLRDRLWTELKSA
ncbi:spermidine/putrescine ABC transporter substrate-binding protein [uncultured Paludibaculum sp.]|uniref:ABC transporter substrate-binding protein n=1 Tax=uncultured Paludibaculum sp. TaxID=1765020 RepID=UPI002AAC03F9|nr:spermidine/putrescine ABC transporter substrate-binding protein [uncultured Paludibaculum sp.]